MTRALEKRLVWPSPSQMKRRPVRRTRRPREKMVRALRRGGGDVIVGAGNGGAPWVGSGALHFERGRGIGVELDEAAAGADPGGEDGLPLSFEEECFGGAEGGDGEVVL
jgi:hypothetical protein